MSETIGIGLVGLGTVGSATLELLRNNAQDIGRRAGVNLVLRQIAVRDLQRPRAVDLGGITLSGDALALARDPDLPIIVELVGGTELARELLLTAIDAGKHVVTANKALIAEHGNEIFAAAHAKGVAVGFEAAVAGAIPILKVLREGLAGNTIKRVAGIINGTANFILTSMSNAAGEFQQVLAQAQQLGYAEADPTFDVEGIDSAHKLTILASIAFGIPLNFEAVYREGINGIAEQDLRHARALGYRVKHLGIAQRQGNGISLRVHPTLVPEQKLLASVDGVMNAVMVQGDASGETLYYGPGAGGAATASAVVADLVDIARAMGADPDHRAPFLAFHHDHLQQLPEVAMGDVCTGYYLRMQARDRPGVLARITRILGDDKISIEAMQQQEPLPGSEFADIIMLTHPVREAQMNSALAAIADLDDLRGSIIRHRVEHLD